MKWRLLLGLLIAFAGRPGVGGAQPLPFTHYTPESEVNPLPSAGVEQVFQDRLGYVWMAAFSSGLVRYDGARMEVYDLRDGLRDLSVRGVLEDPAGRLWVASNGGLAVSERPLSAYGPGQRVRFTTRFGGRPLLAVGVVRARMAVDRSGWLWVGTEAEGIVRYRVAGGPPTAQVIRTASPGGGADGYVSALAARRDGSVWVTLLQGEMLVFSPGIPRPRQLTTQSGSPERKVVLHEGPDGVLWYGQVDGEIGRIRTGSAQGSAAFVPAGRLAGIVSSLATGRDGTLWATSEGGGLLRRNVNGGARVFARADGLLGDVVNHVMEDREGNVWVAQAGGISKLRRNYRAFEGLAADGERPALPAPGVNAVVPGAPGGPCRFWAGTDGGLACVQPNGGGSPSAGSTGEDRASVFFQQADGLRGDVVRGLAWDARGRLWIGTDGGINVLTFPSASDAGTVSPPGAARSRPVMVGGVRAVLSSYAVGVSVAAALPLGPGGRAGEAVAFPGYGALHLLVGEAWVELGASHGLPATLLHAVALDETGHLWVGSRDHGLYRTTRPVAFGALGRAGAVQPRFERVWSVETGAPTNEIETLLAHGGVVWVGTLEGLFALDPATARPRARLTQAQGLLANNATSMALSPTTGTLWVGTNRGLAEVDPRRARVLRTVTKADGLFGEEVWWFGSVAVAPGGTVLFGTAKGLAVYHPALDRPNPLPPLLHFRRAEFRGSARARNEANFEYAGLSFANERAVRYRTRLVGFDRTWSAVTGETKLHYTNLRAFFRPRAYTLEVLARNESGRWTPTPLAYTFRVSPPWWMEAWAFAIYAVLLAGLGFIVYYSQHRRVLLRERARAHEREQGLRVEAAEAQARALNADNARKTEELDRARRLQLSLLPRTLPTHGGVEVAAFMKTATEVGGDYYDFHVDADGVMTFVIGDATGHGTSAGTVVTATKGLFLLLADEPDLISIVRRAGAVLKGMRLPRLYMALALLRLRGHDLEVVGAGMPAALLYRAASKGVEEIPLKGMPLGGMSGYPYSLGRLTLAPGDALLLMSDGFPELFDCNGQMLGYDRVAGVFAEVAHRSPDVVIAHMASASEAWAAQGATESASEDEDHRDDITFVALRVTG